MCFGLSWHLGYTGQPWPKRRFKDSVEERVARKDFRENWLYPWLLNSVGTLVFALRA